MRHAIEKSCNVYFYTLGNMLGVDKIYKWAEKLGMVGKTGIDLPNEQESLIPEHRVEDEAHGRALVSGRDDFRVDRSGSGVGDAGGTGGDDLDGGQRRHASHAACHQGGRRGQRMEADAGPRPWPTSVAFKPDTLAALSRRPLDGGQRGGHR